MPINFKDALKKIEKQDKRHFIESRKKIICELLNDDISLYKINQYLKDIGYKGSYALLSNIVKNWEYQHIHLAIELLEKNKESVFKSIENNEIILVQKFLKAHGFEFSTEFVKTWYHDTKNNLIPNEDIPQDLNFF